jgi:hypothetical protein
MKILCIHIAQAGGSSEGKKFFFQLQISLFVVCITHSLVAQIPFGGYFTYRILNKMENNGHHQLLFVIAPKRRRPFFV